MQPASFDNDRARLLSSMSAQTTPQRLLTAPLSEAWAAHPCPTSQACSLSCSPGTGLKSCSCMASTECGCCSAAVKSVLSSCCTSMFITRHKRSISGPIDATCKHARGSQLSGLCKACWPTWVGEILLSACTMNGHISCAIRQVLCRLGQARAFVNTG